MAECGVDSPEDPVACGSPMEAVFKRVPSALKP